MAYIRKKFYYKEKDIPQGLKTLYVAYDKLQENPLFSKLNGTVIPKTSHLSEKGSISCVTKNGDIFANISAELDTYEWAYVLAHNLLHLAFGHFDKDKMPVNSDVYPLAWNKACDIYVARFLADIGFGKSIFPDPAAEYSIKLNDEVKIYEHLIETESISPEQTYGLNTINTHDMIGIDSPIIYKNGEKNEYMLNPFHLPSHTLLRELYVMLVDMIFLRKKILW